IAGALPLVVFVAAVAMLDAERGAADANIESFGDAAWWAVTTMTTVGYGDRFPVTTEGRLIASALMLAGIALLGVVTAALASWFVERIGDRGGGRGTNRSTGAWPRSGGSCVA
nr:two pore domain potassium channel family protein [Propionibacteriales bacterium]